MTDSGAPRRLTAEEWDQGIRDRNVAKAREVIARDAPAPDREGVFVSEEAVARIHAVLDRPYDPNKDLYDLEEILNDIFPPRPITRSRPLRPPPRGEVERVEWNPPTEDRVDFIMAMADDFRAAEGKEQYAEQHRTLRGFLTEMVTNLTTALARPAPAPVNDADMVKLIAHAIEDWVEGSVDYDLSRAAAASAIHALCQAGYIIAPAPAALEMAPDAAWFTTRPTNQAPCQWCGTWYAVGIDSNHCSLACRSAHEASQRQPAPAAAAGVVERITALAYDYGAAREDYEYRDGPIDVYDAAYAALTEALARPDALVGDITEDQREAIRRQVDHLNSVSVSGGAVYILALDRADAERDAMLLAPLVALTRPAALVVPQDVGWANYRYGYEPDERWTVGLINEHPDDGVSREGDGATFAQALASARSGGS